MATALPLPVSRRVTRATTTRKAAGRKSIVGYWTCTKCTLNNELTAAFCEACGSEAFKDELEQTTRNADVYFNFENLNSDPDWSCSACSYENKAGTTHCEICETKKDEGNNSIIILSPIQEAVGAPRSRPQMTPELAPFLGETGHNRSRSAINTGSETGPTEEDYQEIVRRCEQLDTNFVDDSFPPAPKSLFFNPRNSGHAAAASSHQDLENNRSLVQQWLHPREIVLDNGKTSGCWAVLRNPLPNDITQGVLGNCWFLSALAVVAERRELVERILVTKEISSVGAYLVRLCVQGTWTTVVVDDTFPCDRFNRLVYSKAKRRQLWVPLIEKAAAKIHGCYEALARGHCIEGLATLTGYPCVNIRFCEQQDTDLAWAQILSCHAAGFLMAASCGTTKLQDRSVYEDKGLRMNHAYSVMSVEDIHGLRLVQLRNPWGRFSWNGDWSDKSDIWSPELKRKLKPTQSANGIFWMSFQDMLEYFSYIDVCKTHRTLWFEKRLEGFLAPTSAYEYQSCIQISVKEPTELDISLFQKGAVEIDPNNPRSRYPNLDLGMGVFRSDRQSSVGECVEVCNRDIKNFVNLNVFLQPGRYLVVPMAFGHYRTIGSNELTTLPRFVMAFHSAKKIGAKMVEPPKYLLADAMIQVALKTGDVILNSKDGSMKGYTTHPRLASGVVAIVENRSKKFWEVECDCEGSLNVVSTRNQLITLDLIPPMHRQVLTILTHQDVTHGFRTSVRMSGRDVRWEDVNNGSRRLRELQTRTGFQELATLARVKL